MNEQERAERALKALSYRLSGKSPVTFFFLVLFSLALFFASWAMSNFIFTPFGFMFAFMAFGNRAFAYDKERYVFKFGDGVSYLQHFRKHHILWQLCIGCEWIYWATFVALVIQLQF